VLSRINAALLIGLVVVVIIAGGILSSMSSPHLRSNRHQNWPHHEAVLRGGTWTDDLFFRKWV